MASRYTVSINVRKNFSVKYFSDFNQIIIWNYSSALKRILRTMQGSAVPFHKCLEDFIMWANYLKCLKIAQLCCFIELPIE